MELLQAVNAVLPHLGEHVITRIEGSRHPTVDLILAAIDRQRMSLLAEGLWFNELAVDLPVNTDGQIESPEGALAIYGVGCNIEMDGEKLIDLDTGSWYFTRPVRAVVVVDKEFNKLPVAAALYCAYSAGAEVYLQDFGAEKSVEYLQQLAEKQRYILEQEELRKRKFRTGAGRFTRSTQNLRAVRFR